MTEVKRKIHVIGINSYIFEDLPSKLQDLFLKTENIAVPNSYFEEIQSWRDNDLKKKRNHSFRATVITNFLTGLDLKKLTLF